MIFDAVRFTELLNGSNIKERALRAFTDHIEKRLDVRVVKDSRTIPYGRSDLLEPLQRAQLLKDHGVISEFGRVYRAPDEPPTKAWYALCNEHTAHQTGGTTWESDENALYAATSEALERYIWMTQNDYFVNPTIATYREITAIGPSIAPENITGFTEAQRTRHAARILRPDAAYLWVQGISLTHSENTFVPAQIVSGISRRHMCAPNEPIIRQQNTNGLATWPTQCGARLAGILEVIEREAYMIMWLNQLTLPRIALDTLRRLNPSLGRAVSQCERYRLKPHVIRLQTDAPTHAVAVVLEDMSGKSPRFSFGIRAHRSLPTAIEKAMCESIRAFRSYHIWENEGKSWDTTTPIETIGHRERLYYWGEPENAKRLEFLVQGPEIEVEAKEWENDTIEENLERIVQWCRTKHFNVVSVPLTHSAKNPTDLHIEMVIVPEMVPTYLNEASRQFGGERWHEVPRALGYTPRKEPFAESPHPFS